MLRPILVGVAAAEAASVSLPSAALPGDLLLVHAFRDGSAVNPGVASGWTTIANTWDGTSCSSTTARRIFAVGDTATGTFTNATGILVVAIRNVDEGAPLLANTTQGTGATVTFTASSPVATLAQRHNILVFATMWHRSVDIAADTVPSGMTLVQATSGAGTTSEYGIYRCVTIDDGWESTTTTPGGTASGWMTCVWQLKGKATNGFGLVSNHSPGVSCGSALNSTAVGRYENTGIMSVGERRVSLGGF